MDLATIIGIIMSFGLVLAAIVSGSTLLIYIDVASFLIVVGGTVGATLVAYPLGQVIGVIKVFKKTLFSKVDDPSVIIENFLEYANKARREGILSLEPVIKELQDAFLKKGLQLTVDGLEPQTIQEILETEIGYLEDRHESGAEIVAALGAYAPAMGMIGTVIGLVAMLQTMSDPSTIGPAMAVALLTTFYGALLANLVFNPMSAKLKVRSKQEVLVREMTMEGILSISRGENPRIIEEKLNGYLAPGNRAVSD